MRSKAGSGRYEATNTYDANGNLTEDEFEVYNPGGGLDVTYSNLYVYDAFGRMVSADMGGVPTSVYRYNGLGHRIMWQYDVDSDLNLENSGRLYLCYDERWRNIATYWDDDDSDDAKERFVFHCAGARGLGGSSYIDSVILRDRDNSGDGWSDPSDGVLEERIYYIQNWRADVVSIISTTGEILEYVRYSSYGVPTSFPKGDYDLDGDVDASDTSTLTSMRSAGYGFDLDFNQDGNVDGDDSTDHATYVSGYAGGTGGRLTQSRSAIFNRIGYAGYQWDPTAAMDHVRYQVYLPEVGRWTRRDPVGYLNGVNLFQYVTSSPIVNQDPQGLIAVRCQDDLFRRPEPGLAQTSSWTCRFDLRLDLSGCCNARQSGDSPADFSQCVSNALLKYEKCATDHPANPTPSPRKPLPPLEPHPGEDPNLPPLPFDPTGMDCMATCERVSAIMTAMCATSIFNPIEAAQCQGAVARALTNCYSCCGGDLAKQRQLQCAQEMWLDVLRGFFPQIDPLDPSTWPMPEIKLPLNRMSGIARDYSCTNCAAAGH